jgi:AraC family transcriptional regulator
MEPEIVELGEMTVVGIQSLISSKHNLIPKLWEKFMSRDKEVKHMSNKNAAFGVSFDMQEIPSEGEDAKKEYQFFYLVGLAVDGTNNIPEGMTYKKVLAHKYAKFTHKGLLSKLTETYNDIFSKWLPASEYTYDPVTGCDLEWYDNRFKMDSEESEFDIYVPIK